MAMKKQTYYCTAFGSSSPTKKGATKWIKNRKYAVISSKKTGKNCYTTVWREIPKKKLKKVV